MILLVLNNTQQVPSVSTTSSSSSSVSRGGSHLLWAGSAILNVGVIIIIALCAQGVLPACIFLCHPHNRSLGVPERGVRSSGTGDGCKPPGGCEESAWVLWKSIQDSVHLSTLTFLGKQLFLIAVNELYGSRALSSVVTLLALIN